MDPQEARSIVLDLLDELYLPTTPSDLSLCAEAARGVRIPEDVISDLARRDREEFAGGTPRDVWICPALSYPDGSADDDYLTRSDWRARNRLVEGALSEAQELWLLRVLCDMTSTVEERETSGETRHRFMDRIDDLTIHFSRSVVEQRRSRAGIQQSDVRYYREIAEDLGGPLRRVEIDKQHEVAEAIEGLPPAERYFGR